MGLWKRALTFLFVPGQGRGRRTSAWSGTAAGGVIGSAFGKPMQGVAMGTALGPSWTPVDAPDPQEETVVVLRTAAEIEAERLASKVHPADDEIIELAARIIEPYWFAEGEHYPRDKYPGQRLCEQDLAKDKARAIVALLTKHGALKS